MSTPFRALEAEALARMTPAEHAEYNEALADTELQLQLAELIYRARTQAGLTQAALAEKAGTSPSKISAFESGAQIPTIAVLRRLAGAVGRRLRIDLTETQATAKEPA